MGLGQTLIDGAELGYTSLGVSCYDWKNNDRESHGSILRGASRRTIRVNKG